MMSAAASSCGSESPWTVVGEHSSLVGQRVTVTLHKAADQYTWLPSTLAFVDMGLDEYEHLAGKIGSQAAAEVALLAVARACGDHVSKWKRAKELGIPWQQKNGPHSPVCKPSTTLLSQRRSWRVWRKMLPFRAHLELAKVLRLGAWSGVLWLRAWFWVLLLRAWQTLMMRSRA